MQPSKEGTFRGPEGASVRALEEPGKVYAVYMHHGRIVKGAKPRYQVDAVTASRQVTMQLPAGTYTALWRDTRTGKDLKKEKLSTTGETKTMSPAYSEDIVLLIRANGR
jgi:hypothetical protein